MKRQMRWLALSLMTLVTGCMTLEERQARLDETCRGYGFVRGTDAYKNCWMKVDMASRKATADAINSVQPPK